MIIQSYPYPVVVIIDLDAIIKAFTELLKVLIGTFGPLGTAIFLVIFLILSIAWRLYNDRRKDKEISEALKEKDRAIQRLAEDNRVYRIKDLMSQGWTEDQIEKFVLMNSFENVVDARKQLERESVKPKELPEPKKGKQKGKS